MESSPAALAAFAALGLLAALGFFFGPSFEKEPPLPSLEKLLSFVEPLFGAEPGLSVLLSFEAELFLFFPKELLSVRSLPPCLLLLNLPLSGPDFSNSLSIKSC